MEEQRINVAKRIIDAVVEQNEDATELEIAVKCAETALQHLNYRASEDLAYRLFGGICVQFEAEMEKSLNGSTTGTLSLEESL